MKKWEIIVIVVVIIVVVLVASGIIASISSMNQSGSSSPPPPQTQTITVISTGTVYSLKPGYSVDWPITAPYSASVYLTGSYNSNNNIEVAVMTSEQYGAFTQNAASIQNAYWYSGDNTGATINNIALTSGESYYVMFYDANIFTSDTFTIVNAISMTYLT